MKILLIDVETQPDVVYAWSVYESNAIAVREHWQLLSFSAQWYPGGKVVTKGLCDYPGYRAGGSDRKLLGDVWNLLDEADIVVAHNGAHFDIRKINARFIAHGMTPPSPYKIVDTKREVKRVAAFSSNKLDWLSQQLDIGKKLEHEGWPMWQGCMAGDRAMWAKMKKYNTHDINLLRELYTRISPWITQPNAAMWSDVRVCPNPACGKPTLQRRGLARTMTRLYIRFQCSSCGKWGRAVHAEKQRKAEVVGIR